MSSQLARPNKGRYTTPMKGNNHNNNNNNNNGRRRGRGGGGRNQSKGNNYMSPSDYPDGNDQPLPSSDIPSDWGSHPYNQPSSPVETGWGQVKEDVADAGWGPVSKDVVSTPWGDTPAVTNTVEPFMEDRASSWKDPQPPQQPPSPPILPSSIHKCDDGIDDLKNQFDKLNTRTDEVVTQDRPENQSYRYDMSSKASNHPHPHPPQHPQQQQQQYYNNDDNGYGDTYQAVPNMEDNEPEYPVEPSSRRLAPHNRSYYEASDMRSNNGYNNGNGNYSSKHIPHQHPHHQHHQHPSEQHHSYRDSYNNNNYSDSGYNDQPREPMRQQPVQRGYQRSPSPIDQPREPMRQQPVQRVYQRSPSPIDQQVPINPSYESSSSYTTRQPNMMNTTTSNITSRGLPDHSPPVASLPAERRGPRRLERNTMSNTSAAPSSRRHQPPPPPSTFESRNEYSHPSTRQRPGYDRQYERDQSSYDHNDAYATSNVGSRNHYHQAEPPRSMSPPYNEYPRNDRPPPTRHYNEVVTAPPDTMSNMSHRSPAQSIAAPYDYAAHDNLMENQYDANGASGFNIMEPDDCVPKWDGSVDIKDTVAKYVYHFLALNDMELQEEENQMEVRLNEWGMERLIEEGLVLLDMIGTMEDKFYSMYLLVFRTRRGHNLPYMSFMQGDMLKISREHPMERDAFEVTVLEKTPRELRVVTREVPPDIDEGSWRIDQAFSSLPYQRIEKALLSLCQEGSGKDVRERGARRQEKQRRHQEQRGDDLEGDYLMKADNPRALKNEGSLFIGTTLKDVLVSHDTRALAGKPSDIFNEYPRLLDWINSSESEQSILAPSNRHGNNEGRHEQRKQEKGLNHSQLSAVKLALRNRFSLIVGPPGTGKTTTTVKLVQIVRELTDGRIPILVCAKTNVAVDNLLEGLLNAGVNAIRTGVAARVRSDLQHATMDAKMAEHPEYSQLKECQESWEALRKMNKYGNNDRQPSRVLKDIKKASSTVRHLSMKIASDILDQGPVVCATCTGAGSGQLKGYRFSLVVIDEGSQCTEPECIIPLAKGAQHAIIVGDHCQLPPVIMSGEAGRQGLSLSLFDRLLRREVPSVMLETQYRMHPGICAIPSEMFYDGRLRDGIQPLDRPVPFLPALPGLPGSGMAGAVLPPVLFIDLKRSAEKRASTKSVKNEEEIKVVMELIYDLFDHNSDLSMKHIGIITPYAEQRRIIHDIVQDDSRLLKKLRVSLPSANNHRHGGASSSSSSSYRHSLSTMNNNNSSGDVRRLGNGAMSTSMLSEEETLEVHTVDGFQGREKDIIIMSTVRANVNGTIGFLSDWRRLNVAITRARRLLVIVGNIETLSYDEHWDGLIKRAARSVNAAIVDGDMYLSSKERAQGQTTMRVRY